LLVGGGSKNEKEARKNNTSESLWENRLHYLSIPLMGNKLESKGDPDEALS